MGKRLTIEYVKGKIEKVEGYKLLSKEYKGSRTKLELKCPEGHIFLMHWNSFQQKQRCPECHYDSKRLTIEYVKEKIEKVEGYKLLSKEYVSNNTKLEIQCPEGHVFWMIWNCWHRGQRCPECFINNQKYDHGYIKEYIEQKGYKLLSKYTDSVTKLKLECPQGHKFGMIWNNFQQGQECPECWKESTSSKGEKEVLKYIQSLTTTAIVENDRTQIINPKTGKYLELDVFLPDLMKAIEYNGTYWHSSDEAIYRDNQKVIQCKEKEIDFSVINEEDWYNDKGRIKQRIKVFLND